MTAPDAAQGGRRSPWILGPWQDLALFIATPLAVIPAVAGAQIELTAEDLALYVAAFGAVGHHLPGMLRAYGDRELFARFRTRFVAAPVFLVATCVYFSHHAPDALGSVALLWGLWHGLAQVYGFARIYDAKAGSVPPLTARIDLLLCVAWFGAGVIHSPGRMAEILRRFYEAGGPFVAPEAIATFQVAWDVGTALVTGAFVANLLRERARGRRPSGAKALLFLSSFGFWWYAMVGINHVIVGVALFEIFHDVQYLSIVWSYNRKRVASGHGVGSLLRLIFRRSGAMIGVYVGLVFAYGAGPLLASTVESEALGRSLHGLILASTLLHFYFDAFIWSVRDPATREGLDIATQTSRSPLASTVPDWAPHLARWGLLVVPLVALGLASSETSRPERARSEALVASLPESGEAHTRLGVVHLDAGDEAAALREFYRAIDLQPKQPDALANIGVLELRRGGFARAEPALRRALDLDPDAAGANEGYARVLLARGEVAQAAAHFERALRSEPDFSDAHYGLGLARMFAGQLDAASHSFRRALTLAPAEIGDSPNARQAFAQLAQAYAAAGRQAEAQSWQRLAQEPPGRRAAPR